MRLFNFNTEFRVINKFIKCETLYLVQKKYFWFWITLDFISSQEEAVRVCNDYYKNYLSSKNQKSYNILIMNIGKFKLVKTRKHKSNNHYYLIREKIFPCIYITINSFYCNPNYSSGDAEAKERLIKIYNASLSKQKIIYNPKFKTLD